MKRKLTVFLAAVVVALALLLGAGAVQAAEVIIDDSGTNATGILALDVDGNFYDVAFMKTTPLYLYGFGPNAVFPFDSEEETITVSIAIIAALNTVPEVVTVGPTDSDKIKYFIGYGIKPQTFGEDEYNVVGGEYDSDESILMWVEGAPLSQRQGDEQVYATFTAIQVVSVPDVVGQDLASADADIINAGLFVGDPTGQYGDSVPAGEVIS